MQTTDVKNGRFKFDLTKEKQVYEESRNRKSTPNSIPINVSKRKPARSKTQTGFNQNTNRTNGKDRRDRYPPKRETLSAPGGNRGLSTMPAQSGIKNGQKTQPVNKPTKRILGNKASREDVQSASFRQSHKFNIGEVVLVPRTRGGFTYGKITESTINPYCYLDPNIKDGVKHVAWKVVYPNAQRTSMYKDLPTIYLGKLPSTTKKIEQKVPPTKILQSLPDITNEAPGFVDENNEDDFSDDDDLGETIMFTGMIPDKTSPNERTQERPVSSSTSNSQVVTKTPTENEEKKVKELSEMEKLLASENREIGASASEKDLENITLSTRNLFTEGEIVLVPRSAGGFTYGKVIGEISWGCPLGKHQHKAWTVVIDETVEPRIVKHLFGVSLGKVHAAGNTTLVPSINVMNSGGVTDTERSPRFGNGRQRGGGGSRGRGNGRTNGGRRNREVDNVMVKKDELDEFKDFEFKFDEDVTKFKDNFNDPDVLIDINDDVDDLYDDVDDINIDGNKDDKEEKKTRGLLSISPIQSLFLDKTIPAAAPNLSPNVTPPKIGIGMLSPSSAVITVPSNSTDTVTTQYSKNNYNNNNYNNSRKSSFQNRGNSNSNSNSRRSDTIVVIDGPNVARKHGKQSSFSVRGIQVALDYYTKRGHEVVAFLPQQYLTRKPKPLTGTLSFEEFLPMADDLPLLQKLVDDGSVVLTPPQDYDDSYCIQYAKSHNAVIVSNDRYWDHIDKFGDDKFRVKKWIRNHVISFTFVRNEFLPNPDFVFPCDKRTDQNRKGKKSDGYDVEG